MSNQVSRSNFYLNPNTPKKPYTPDINVNNSPFQQQPNPFSATPSPFSQQASPFASTPNPFQQQSNPFSSEPDYLPKVPLMDSEFKDIYDPENMTEQDHIELEDVRKKNYENENAYGPDWLSWLTRTLDAPGHATRGLIYGFLSGDFKGFWDTFKGTDPITNKEYVSARKIYDLLGIPQAAGKVDLPIFGESDLANFLGEVLLDPLTWITLGVKPAAKAIFGKATKIATTGLRGKAIENTVTAIGRHVKAGGALLPIERAASLLDDFGINGINKLLERTRQLAASNAVSELAVKGTNIGGNLDKLVLHTVPDALKKDVKNTVIELAHYLQYDADKKLGMFNADKIGDWLRNVVDNLPSNLRESSAKAKLLWAQQATSDQAKLYASKLAAIADPMLGGVSEAAKREAGLVGARLSLEGPAGFGRVLTSPLKLIPSKTLKQAREALFRKMEGATAEIALPSIWWGKFLDQPYMAKLRNGMNWAFRRHGSSKAFRNIMREIEAANQSYGEETLINAKRAVSAIREASGGNEDVVKLARSVVEISPPKMELDTADYVAETLKLRTNAIQKAVPDATPEFISQVLQTADTIKKQANTFHNATIDRWLKRVGYDWEAYDSAFVNAMNAEPWGNKRYWSRKRDQAMYAIGEQLGIPYPARPQTALEPIEAASGIARTEETLFRNLHNSIIYEDVLDDNRINDIANSFTQRAIDNEDSMIRGFDVTKTVPKPQVIHLEDVMTNEPYKWEIFKEGYQPSQVLEEIDKVFEGINSGRYKITQSELNKLYDAKMGYSSYYAVRDYIPKSDFTRSIAKELEAYFFSPNRVDVLANPELVGSRLTLSKSDEKLYQKLMYVLGTYDNVAHLFGVDAPEHVSLLELIGSALYANDRSQKHVESFIHNILEESVRNPYERMDLITDFSKGLGVDSGDIAELSRVMSENVSRNTEELSGLSEKLYKNIVENEIRVASSNQLGSTAPVFMESQRALLNKVLAPDFRTLLEKFEGGAELMDDISKAYLTSDIPIRSATGAPLSITELDDLAKYHLKQAMQVVNETTAHEKGAAASTAQWILNTLRKTKAVDALTWKGRQYGYDLDTMQEIVDSIVKNNRNWEKVIEDIGGEIELSNSVVVSDVSNRISAKYYSVLRDIGIRDPKNFVNRYVFNRLVNNKILDPKHFDNFINPSMLPIERIFAETRVNSFNDGYDVGRFLGKNEDGAIVFSIHDALEALDQGLLTSDTKFIEGITESIMDIEKDIDIFRDISYKTMLEDIADAPERAWDLSGGWRVKYPSAPEYNIPNVSNSWHYLPERPGMEGVTDLSKKRFMHESELEELVNDYPDIMTKFKKLELINPESPILTIKDPLYVRNDIAPEVQRLVSKGYVIDQIAPEYKYLKQVQQFKSIPEAEDYIIRHLNQAVEKGQGLFDYNPVAAIAYNEVRANSTMLRGDWQNQVKRGWGALDEYAPAHYMKVNHPSFEGYRFDPQIATAINHWYRAMNPETITGFSRTFGRIKKRYDSFNKFLRFTTTKVYPAYWLRNLLSDSWQSFLGQGLTVESRVQSFNLLRNRRNYKALLAAGNDTEAEKVLKKLQNTFIDTPTGKLSHLELLDELENQHITGAGMFFGGYLSPKALERTEKYLSYSDPLSEPGVKQIGRMWNNTADKANEYAVMMEDLGRTGHYIARRTAGDTVDQAADSVRTFLFDYGDAGLATEAIERYLWFARWTRKNLGFGSYIAMTRPRVFSHLARVMREAEKPGEGKRYFTQDEIPEWIRKLGIRVKDENNFIVDGKIFSDPAYVNTQYLIPQSEVMEIISSFYPNPIEGTGKLLLGRLNPMISLPIELAKNIDLFREKPIKAAAAEKVKVPIADDYYLDPYLAHTIRKFRGLNTIWMTGERGLERELNKSIAPARIDIANTKRQLMQQLMTLSKERSTLRWRQKIAQESNGVEESLRLDSAISDLSERIKVIQKELKAYDDQRVVEVMAKM